jgi:hypothetical protein
MKSGISQISDVKSGYKLRSDHEVWTRRCWRSDEGGGEGGEGSKARQGSVRTGGLGNDAMQSQSL